MGDIDGESELQKLRRENEQLRQRLASYEGSASAAPPADPAAKHPNSILSNADIRRYSRQLLVGGLGAGVQRRLLDSKVLVIGAGGLGSALLPYLTGAGVGTIGIVDFDTVEVSNLHRQVLYREWQQGRPKAQCAAEALRALNPGIAVHVHEQTFSHDTAEALLQGYDAVVDASDNPLTRYLVNDACVLSGKPLISGSALGLEGQVTVYGWRKGGEGGAAAAPASACYRCVYPQPMAHEAGRRCSDNGVVGPVTGVIGSLQALEALKVLGGFGAPLSGSMCTFDGSDGTFYELALPPRRLDCAVCGTAGSNEASSSGGGGSDGGSIRSLEDSRRWCEAAGLSCAAPPRLPDDLPSVSCAEYAALCASSRPGEGHILLDVRPAPQFSICHLAGAVNEPYAALARPPRRPAATADSGAAPGAVCPGNTSAGTHSGGSGADAAAAPEAPPPPPPPPPAGGGVLLGEELQRVHALSRGGALPVYCLCRRGNDSRRAVMLLRGSGAFGPVFDVRGGLARWREEVEPDLPHY